MPLCNALCLMLYIYYLINPLKETLKDKYCVHVIDEESKGRLI